MNYQELNAKAKAAKQAAEKAELKKQSLITNGGKSTKAVNNLTARKKAEAKEIAKEVRQTETEIQKQLVKSSRFITLQYKKLVQTGADKDVCSIEEQIFVNKYLKQIKFVRNVLDVLGLVTYSQAVKFYLNGCVFTENEVINLCRKWYALSAKEQTETAKRGDKIFAAFKSRKDSGMTYASFETLQKMFAPDKRKESKAEAQILVNVRPFMVANNDAYAPLFKSKEGENILAAFDQWVNKQTGLKNFADLKALTSVKGREMFTLSECLKARETKAAETQKQTTKAA